MVMQSGGVMSDATIRAQGLQPVTIGRTVSRRWGLFTGGYLAWPLSDEDVLHFAGNDASLHEYCKRRGFGWTGEWSTPVEEFGK